MKILVCISHVPDTLPQKLILPMVIQNLTPTVCNVINPNDEFGLTAIWFQEQQGATVTVANVGGPETEPTLRKSTIMQTKLICVNQQMVFLLRHNLEVIKNGGYDLVIAGKESLDYNGGMVPGMIGILGYNFVNSVPHITIEGTAVKAVREIDGGKETVSTTLPLIVGGRKG
jgi:electron transfer flavoprotein beta subunit